MKRLSLCLAASALAFVLLCAAALAQAGEPVRARLDAPAELRPLLAEHLAALRQAFDPADESDRLRLLRLARREAAELLATEGYFAPTVELQVDEPAAPSLRVTPGRRALVSALNIEFRGDISAPGTARAARVQALRDGWALTPGRPFRQQDWDAAKQRVLQELLATDYAAATLVDSLAEVDPEQASVALRLVFDSGPAFTLGEIEVLGLEHYDRALIDRYRAFSPGEPYSQERLLALQSALQGTPYFASVLVDIERDPQRAQRAKVSVRVREARSKRLGAGIGFSSNTRFRVEATYSDANLFDRAWLLSGGARLESLRQSAYAEIHFPPTQKDYRDSIGTLVEASDIQNLKTDRYAVGAKRNRTRGRIETELALQAQRETTEPANAPPEEKRALTLNWSWTYRDVDNPLDPTSGYVLNLQIGGATKLLVSDQNFLRGYVRFQRFFSLSEKDLLTLRGEAGLTLSPDRERVPEDFLFRTGGAQSVRGYTYQSLGEQQGDAIVGGRRLLVGSIEYTRWITPKWGGALFYDAGNAIDTTSDWSLASGYGVGLRWRSPVGPLALDLAWSQRDGTLRPAFSVAIAF